ncbi:hypothetical protein SAMN06265380_104206 [Ruegeria faecimaris]|uniref:Uncharacterized protein n=2 Tax=Ruegeria faecimaris TaxID=686389 RepID=A0A521D3J7_9RHOB|nr:hypothetical protein SAMN06265380_104206 [Ruegeria faecimaris]
MRHVEIIRILKKLRPDSPMVEFLAELDHLQFADTRAENHKRIHGLLSFTTVVYSKDFPLLELQALSFARFVDPDQVGSIRVIMNDVDEPALRAMVEPILASYGPLRPKVEVLSGDDVLLAPGQCARRSISDRILVENRYRIPGARKGGWRGNNGYRTQQVLKLGSARAASTENIVILDTKNLFLRPFQEAEFFSDSGAARIPFIGVKSDYHRRWLEQSFDALGASIPETDGIQTTNFATPYPVRRSLILDLLQEINARHGSVQSLFASRRRPSEFMLLNAFCLKSEAGFAPWFEPSGNTSIGLWPSFSGQKLTDELSRLDDPETLTLGLHNRALYKLPADIRNRVFHELESRGICDRSIAEAALNRTAALTGQVEVGG